MSLRNVLRNRIRSALGMFAAAMGAALMVYGLLANAAMFYMIDFQFYQVWRADVDLTFESERSYDALLESQRLPGVSYAEPVLSLACTFENGQFTKRGGITGLVPGARLTTPRDVERRAIQVPTTGVVLSRTLAEILHVGPGDTLSIRPTKGLREPHEVRVASVVNSYVGLTAYADLSYLCGLIHEEFAITGVQLEVDADPAVRQRLYRELKQLPALQGFNAREDIVKNLMDTFVGANLVFIGMLILFAGVIFFGSTLNFSLIALAEREREVATLLVLGYSPYTVGALFLRESLLVNLAGALLGLPLGYLLMLGMVANYSSELFRIPVVAPPQVWGWTLSLSLVFCLISHIAVQRSIHTTDWWEKLKVKE